MSLAMLGMVLVVLCLAGIVLDMFFDFDLAVCKWIVVTGISGMALILINFLFILAT